MRYQESNLCRLHARQGPYPFYYHFGSSHYRDCACTHPATPQSPPLHMLMLTVSLRMHRKVLLKRMQNCVRVLVAKLCLSIVSTS